MLFTRLRILGGKLVGLVLALFLSVMFVKCSVEEVSLLTHYQYTIASVTKVYQGTKQEQRIVYDYVVAGKNYKGGTEWDTPIQVGQRYVIRYGVIAPSGNKLMYDLPVPDSISQVNDPKWSLFLQKNNL
jgi:hypothetical protein